MKNPIIIILMLTIAIVALSIRVASLSNDSGNEAKSHNTLDAASGATSTSNSSSVIKCIMTRASVRDFSDKKVSSQTVDTLLKAGMAAPTAMNKQPWQFIVVDKPEILQKLADAMGHGDPIRKCNVAIVACGDMDLAIEGDGQPFWIQDVSAASENILLAAHAMGLGAVWCGVFPVKERVTNISSILGIPENVIPLNVIAIGYPKQPATPKDKWTETKVHYNNY